MLKRDVTQNRRPTAEWHELSLVDTDRCEFADGVPVATEDNTYPFKLRALDEMQLAAAREFGDKLYVRHIEGNFIAPNGEKRNAAELLAMVEDENSLPQPVEVSAEVLHLMARIERMQGLKRDVFDDSPKPEYTARELAIIAVTAPSIWQQLRSAVREIQAQGFKKKASQA